MTPPVARAIPAVGLLHDGELRAAVIRTWEAALARSPYGSIADVPQSPFMTERSLLDHVNEVNERTMDMLHLAVTNYGLVVDHDLALATAILHDVDKPLIYRRDGAAFGYAEGTHLRDHGALGADLCLANGVPAEVAAMVRVHSPFASTGLPATVEGTLVHYADFVSNDLACLQQGASPIHASFRLVPKDGAH